MQDIHGNWIPDSTPKQLEVFNDRSHVLLVSGPRATGKTRGCLNKIVRHLWETDRARCIMFARTKTLAKDAGTWSVLHQNTLPEWINANIGLRYTSFNNGIPGAKVDGTTRSPYFKIRNRHGNDSEMFLFSLDNDDDAETKMKNLEASMFYFSELDNFGDRRVLVVPLAALRIGTFEEQQWIADCNPSEEGEQSWIYQIFLKERLMTFEDFSAHQKRSDLPPMTEQEFKDFYGNMNVIEMFPQDNLFADQRLLSNIKLSCGADAGLYARHVEGKWVWGGGDASRHFRSYFKSHHIIGKADGPEEDWETAGLTDGCYELVTGWDLGEVNHSFHIIEKTFPRTPLSLAMKMNIPYFTIIDELVLIGKEVSHEEFAMAGMEMIEKLEELYGKTFNLEGIAWSDQSAITNYSSIADTFPYQLVAAATGDRIVLRGVPKAHHSVFERVRLVKQLLSQNRLAVSAHCEHTLAMFRDLKKGKDKINFIERDKNKHKHPFDSMSYALLMECAEEIQANASTPNTVKRSLGLVQVG